MDKKGKIPAWKAEMLAQEEAARAERKKEVEGTVNWLRSLSAKEREDAIRKIRNDADLASEVLLRLDRISPETTDADSELRSIVDEIKAAASSIVEAEEGMKHDIKREGRPPFRSYRRPKKK